jgi:hypothetical protein
MKSIVFVLSIIASLKAVADVRTQTFKGTGIDGTACEVEVLREGTKLQNIKLNGHIVTYDAVAEAGSPYHGNKEVSLDANQIFAFAEDNQDLYKSFRYSRSLRPKMETFYFTGTATDGDVKMLASLSLKYGANYKLEKVEATSKVNALSTLTLKSQKFSCE